ncbi:HEAT repeat domain-containing protein [Pleurocapsales cyanobacterium LEGE 06147]|nr:HEAT repeat domain-containing protein [Pleurocapsales cyanobacterium LEGE 06147]
MTETQALIEAVNRADSAEGLLEAVENLADARTEVAIPTLVEVLRYNNPGAAVAAVDGLINIGEPAVPYLLENLDGYNYGARAWAIRVFAGIGDPRSLNLLLEAATTDFSQSVRRAAARGLGTIRWLQLPPQERLPAQEKALNTLILASGDGEWVARYAAVVSLQSLGSLMTETRRDFVEKIEARLTQIKETDSEIAVRARAQLSWQQLKGMVS